MLTIKPNQNMLDMVVQHSGELANLFLLAQLNGVSITANLTPGNNLKPVPITDKRVVSLFEKIDYDCTTFIKPGINSRGIGYMKIGATFIVS
jgi:hypothetical protein